MKFATPFAGKLSICEIDAGKRDALSAQRERDRSGGVKAVYDEHQTREQTKNHRVAARDVDVRRGNDRQTVFDRRQTMRIVSLLSWAG